MTMYKHRLNTNDNVNDVTLKINNVEFRLQIVKQIDDV